ncbi:MAG: DUF1684 domain-containing protein [Ignavibacteriaceae bacterium]|jgi:uncharacterized protein (DUF1684 family)
MRNNKISLLIITLLFISISCSEKKLEQKGSPEYISEVEQWHKNRIERLKTETGWLNLVGLYWLKEGDNAFGSSKVNDIVFPQNAPAFMGKLTLKDSTVHLVVNDGINIYNKGKLVNELDLESDASGDPTILEIGTFRWYIIKRSKGFGIRLRDLESPLLTEFDHIDRYPVRDDWNVKAKFEAYMPPKVISIPTILGDVVEEDSPGAAVFTVNGETYKIDLIDTGKRYWLIFADETSGEETYGAGRYLYTDKQDSAGNMTIDFNLAYNPPCVFTKFATCSFPPKQNFLKLKITAGEKIWGEFH